MVFDGNEIGRDVSQFSMKATVTVIAQENVRFDQSSSKLRNAFTCKTKLRHFMNTALKFTETKCT